MDFGSIKKRMPGQKLPDGKNVGGAGRLTDAVIDRIQANYGEAIRNNSEIGTMKTAISGVYHHDQGRENDFSTAA